MTARYHFPEKQGLYDPRFEHDSCGVGFVCDIKGRRTADIIKKGIRALEHLIHRGAVGADPKTGDGAGILIQMPHEFFAEECDTRGIPLPEKGKYGAGMVFLPAKGSDRRFCEDVIRSVTEKEGLSVLGWRDVPVDNSDIGKAAREMEPVIRHIFIGGGSINGILLERRLYTIRKQAENIVRRSGIKQKTFFYITNISTRTISYKGLLMSSQLLRFFPDLKNKKIRSAFALVHARYSTNTFPTWDLAQPFRFLAHNGEINTLRGNINWMHARESLFRSSLFGRDIKKIFPVVMPGGSDSAMIDNALEMLVLGGRSIAHAMMMLIPEAWQDNPHIDKARRYFYEYHACLMEPWDGPASIAFTDGRFIGATLDRNGLRPSRYVITKDHLAVMASEVGVLDIDPKNIAVNGRLCPGRMFLIDTEEGRIIDDTEIKAHISGRKPYKKWLGKNMVMLDSLPARGRIKKIKGKELLFLQKAFGFSREDIRVIIGPMAEKGIEPTGSMGDDTPLAVLSKRPRLLYDYFKQLFAQVTNPAIDSIREGLVMTMDTYLGREKNLLDETEEHCRRLKIKNPILTNEDLEKIRRYKAKTVSILFKAESSTTGFMKRLNAVCREAEAGINSGFNHIILTDRGVDKEYAALPALLAAGAVHHYLIRKQKRTQAGIIIESGEPREVAHFALLFGYGADCINPYLAYECISGRTGQKNYLKALNKGILKIMSKMGISTLQSYRGAQIFEILGLNDFVVHKCFKGTVSRIGGIGFKTICADVLERHRYACREYTGGLIGGGLYQWRRDGETHLWRPETVHFLQQAVRRNDIDMYNRFAELINNQGDNPCTLRSVLKVKKSKRPVPLGEVEPAGDIMKRFVTGAMSFGSISRETHETLALVMNKLGGKSNSGEGGEDPVRFVPLPGGGSLRSATKQVASGRFGVTSNYLINADELQIKIAQGAKPGEGGQLPGHKVSVTIAKTRYSTPGVTLISPPPHHDIYSIEDLAQLIFDLKNANPKARISVKLVSEAGVGTIAAGVAKGHADMILISGGDGGTGASPISSIKHAGLPWELGLSETHQTLVLNDLRSRVRLQTDGQMRTGRDVIIAAILGAEEYGFATAALITLGCVMLRHCHLNNCSLGIATQEEILRKRFSGRPEYTQNYFYFVACEARRIMAEAGVRHIEDLVGRTDLLEINKDISNSKVKTVDFSRILYRPKAPECTGTYCMKRQDHGIDRILDRRLIRLSADAVYRRSPVTLDLKIKNKDRAAGAMLSSEVSKRYGEDGLPEDTIRCRFRGSAGQSFGAFLAKGITFELEGDANDYVGKGLSGGKIIIYPPPEADFAPDKNIIIGNTTFYGATGGEAYIRGIAGERFCIRNSGLYGVVEGTGDHGCEYMTGGRVVVLGITGRNFAAGMSGGIAYVYDEDGRFGLRCNMGMVMFDEIKEDDRIIIYDLLSNHFKYTGSVKAKVFLDDFGNMLKKFIKVMPLEYKRVIEGARQKEPELLEASDG